MIIRIMIQDFEVLAGQTPEEASGKQGHVCVWSGDVEFLNDHVYVTKISILAEGQPQPICDVPFSLNKGYYMWVPPAAESHGEDPEVAYIASGKVVLEDTSRVVLTAGED